MSLYLHVCLCLYCAHRWSIIAAHLPKRTDNDIKNYWNTNIKKGLIGKGLDPLTYKPIKSNTFQAYGGNFLDPSIDTTNMNHVAQSESAQIEAEARESMLQFGSLPSHLPGLILSKIPTQPCFSSSDSLSTKRNTVYNMYALVLATNHDPVLPVSTLSIPYWQTPSPVSTNIGRFTDTGSSLSYEENVNITETSCQTQKIIEDYMLNSQDDDIIVAVEAFRTTRCESIQELFRGSNDVEGPNNDSFERNV